MVTCHVVSDKHEKLRAIPNVEQQGAFLKKLSRGVVVLVLVLIEVNHCVEHRPWESPTD
jgi:hypothetical protein